MKIAGRGCTKPKIMLSKQAMLDFVAISRINELDRQLLHIYNKLVLEMNN
jgi:hypothetical protein